MGCYDVAMVNPMSFDNRATRAFQKLALGTGCGRTSIMMNSGAFGVALRSLNPRPPIKHTRMIAANAAVPEIADILFGWWR